MESPAPGSPQGPGPGRGPDPARGRTGAPTPREAREIATEGWMYGYALLRNYRTMYAQAVGPGAVEPDGGFGRFRHHSRPRTAADTGVAMPNNDTPYSWAWLDLRAEPWVVSVPATERYYVLAFHDLDTSCVGLIGPRTTGREAGDHLIAGPGWDYVVPERVVGVMRADTELVGCLVRTHVAGPEDVAGLRSVQEQYRLRPLSAFAREGEHGKRPAESVRDTPPVQPAWPAWRDEKLDSAESLALLDFLLGFVPAPADAAEAELWERLARIGVNGAGEFEPEALDPALREAVERGVADARARLEAAKTEATEPGRGDGHLARAVSVDKGLYGLPAEEVWYAGWVADNEGNRPPDAAARDYVLRFLPGQLPPAQFFWSATMYALPDRLLVDNLAARYSVGDRTPGLRYDDEGGLTLYVRAEPPDEPARAANWLPAPAGPFTIAIRIYGPDPSVLDGRWKPPALEVDHG